jgi:hypothetical protein
MRVGAAQVRSSSIGKSSSWKQIGGPAPFSWSGPRIDRQRRRMAAARAAAGDCDPRRIDAERAGIVVQPGQRRITIV